LDIHKPKPWQGWREFLREYVIVVVGVLTALAAEQAAEALHWRHLVGEAREEIAGELGEGLGQAELRVRTLECVDRRLSDLQAAVEAAALTGRLPPTGRPGTPPLFTWSTGAWESAVSSGASSHIAPAEHQGYVGVYGFIRRIDELNRHEAEIWTALYGLAGPGRAIAPDEASQFRARIGEARLANRLIALSGVRMQQIARADGLAVDRQKFNSIAAASLGDLTVCKTLEQTPPSAYGEAPLADSVARARGSSLTSSATGKSR
jgi:hypothetical protein